MISTTNGAKEQLASAAYAYLGEQVTLRRYTPEPATSEVARGTRRDYEITGDAMIRMLALEEKVATLRPTSARGRQSHRGWVERMFRRRARAGS